MQANGQQSSTLTGAEKAAAVLLVMGKDSAGKLADFFSKEELKLVVKAADKLNSLSFSTIDQLVAEFGQNYVNNGLITDSNELSELFGDLTPDDAPKTDRKVSRKKKPKQTKNAENQPLEIETVKAFFETEPIMLSAFFLSTLSDDFTASVLAETEPEMRNTIFKAYLKLRPMDPELATILRQDLTNIINQTTEDDGNIEQIEKAAGVLNYFSEEAGDELIGSIESDSPETAATIRKSLFKFSSITTLDKGTIAIIFDGVESEDIVKVLGNADDALKEAVLNVLSQRNRRMVESEMARGPTPPEEIEAAQRKVSSLVLSLIKEGKITLPEAEAE